ncbi:hypothetical protein pb186bvf_016761 [Paramecium bursaria]
MSTIFDPLHQTLTTISYQSILSSKKIEPQQRSKIKKSRNMRTIFPVLTKIPPQLQSRLASLPTNNLITIQQSVRNRNEPILSIHGSMAYLSVLGKFRKSPHENYFQRSRNSSLVETLLTQMKQQKQ